jgi:hypothetical protein
MFTEESKHYFQKDIKVVPIVGKHCPIDNWGQIDFEERAHLYPLSGIGLSLGDIDLVVLDLDSTNPDEKKELEEFLKDYPTPIQRIGNPNKLPSRFYAKTWQKNKLKEGTLELLAAEKGQQSVCALPPSKHPTGGAFKWVSQPLHSFDLDLIPPLPERGWEGLKKIARKYQAPTAAAHSQITPSDGTRCNHGSYEYISAIMTRKVVDGESLEFITDELLSLDEKINPKTSFFLCPSRKEWKTRDRKENCEKFVMDCMANKIKQGKIQRVELNFKEKEDEPLEEIASKNFKKLPKWEGLGKIIFNELYQNSPIPRSQLCFMSTANLLSILIGNNFYHRGTGCNLYQYGVAPSGYGKDFSFKRSMQILNEAGLGRLIGSTSPTSETIMLMMLQKNKEQCLFINEAESLLKRITNDRTNLGLRECLTDMYDFSGRSHSPKMIINAGKKDKEVDSIGKIFSPFLNILMTSTTQAFNNYAAEDIFNTGFGARFLFYFEDRYKPQKFTTDFNPAIDKTTIKAIKLFKNDSYLDARKPDEVYPLNHAQITPEAEAYYRDMHNRIELEKKENQNSRFFPLITRKMYFINKFVTLHHASINPADYITKPVSVESYVWAQAAVDAITHNMIQQLDDNVSETTYGKKSKEFLRYIRKRTLGGKGTARKEISNRFNEIDLISRRRIIDDLIEQGNIFEKDKLFYASKK